MFGRIFAVFIALIVVVFWFSSATLAGQRPGSMVANLLLSVLLIWQALRALRGRRPSGISTCWPRPPGRSCWRPGRYPCREARSWTMTPTCWSCW